MRPSIVRRSQYLSPPTSSEGTHRRLRVSGTSTPRDGANQNRIPSPRTSTVITTTPRPTRCSSGSIQVKPVAVTPNKTPHRDDRCKKNTPNRSPTSVLQIPSPPTACTAHNNSLNPNYSTRIYWIRHGESLGQVAGSFNRRTDVRLKDCGLSERGIWQAQHIRLPIQEDNSKDVLVFCSPLLRALQTALLAFPNAAKIIVLPELREIGTTSIPENQPRPVSEILHSLEQQCADQNHLHQVLDFSRVPEAWPHHHDRTPTVLRRDKIRALVADLARETLGSTTIVMVCHFHVIRAAFRGSGSNHKFVVADQVDGNIHPANAVPIASRWTAQGQLELLKE